METYLFEGALSVKAIMQAGQRVISKIVIDQSKKDRDTNFIKALANRMEIPIEMVKREVIDALATGKTHGGIIAYGTNRNYQTIEEILNKSEVPFIALLEGIEDPFNFGYILRSLYASGCDGVIVGVRNWENAASTVLKSSAGASEHMSICVSGDFSETIRQTKIRGCQCICAQRSDAVNLYEMDYTGPLLLAIGGEMRGLSKAVLDQSDQNIFIPYANEFRNALNAAAAVTAISFEIVRQRHFNK